MALVITLALGWKIYYLIFNAMLGLIHRCNIYSTMFFSVLTTFLTFLLWYFEVIINSKIEYCQKKTHFHLRYSLFIIAFGLGFFILLHSDEAKTMKREKDEEEKPKFFDHLGLSIVKTFSMFVGELEFSEVPFQVSPRFFGPL